MSTKIFVNLPTGDLERSKRFYTGLGYDINPQFSDENAACVVISEDIYVMVLVEEFFKSFTGRPIPDTTAGTAAILALSADSRAEVDRFAERSKAAGGTVDKAPHEQMGGAMYGTDFRDPDGHAWEVLYMDMSGAEAA